MDKYKICSLIITQFSATSYRIKGALSCLQSASVHLSEGCLRDPGEPGGPGTSRYNDELDSINARGRSNP